MPKAYLITLADIAQIPKLFKKGFMHGHSEPRIAFVGRSNVGKSSLINCLMEQKIARVSATPGKTRAINFYKWEKANKIVADLPGYGFAKVSKKEHQQWSQLLNAYFKSDTEVLAVLMLFDSRHGPTPMDLEALEFFIEKEIPIQIFMTKIDQLKTQSEKIKRKREVLHLLEPYGIPEESLMWVSVHDSKTIKAARNLFYE